MLLITTKPFLDFHKQEYQIENLTQLFSLIKNEQLYYGITFSIILKYFLAYFCISGLLLYYSNNCLKIKENLEQLEL